MKPTEDPVAALIRLALAEDIGPGDVTSLAVIDAKQQASGDIRTKQDCVVSGLAVAEQVFRMVDPEIRWERECHEGMTLKAGGLLARVEGRARSLLAAERVALNFLQHLSGVATLTSQFVLAARGAKILDTRKTIPGWRALEKQAVRAGGGENHRMGLYDRILIKSNHLRLTGSLPAALQKVKGQNVAAEVRSLEEAKTATAAGATHLLIDNSSPEVVTTIATWRAALGRAGRVTLEVSGGITLENVRAYAATGVDFISIGALTHSAPAIDIHMVVQLA